MEKIEKMKQLKNLLDELVSKVYNSLNVDFEDKKLNYDLLVMRVKFATLQIEVSKIVDELESLPFIPD